jgi:hypothetical protein
VRGHPAHREQVGNRPCVWCVRNPRDDRNAADNPDWHRAAHLEPQ